MRRQTGAVAASGGDLGTFASCAHGRPCHFGPSVSRSKPSPSSLMKTTRQHPRFRSPSTSFSNPFNRRGLSCPIAGSSRVLRGPCPPISSPLLLTAPRRVVRCGHSADRATKPSACISHRPSRCSSPVRSFPFHLGLVILLEVSVALRCWACLVPVRRGTPVAGGFRLPQQQHH
jgi:hypothetical protein